MKYLTIDTTTKATALGLAEDGRLMAEGFLHTTKNHSERLIPLLDQVLTAANWKPEELSLIGVVRGPGSFTGIRIGIATAQGMAQVLKIPVLGILSLDALAWAGTGRDEDVVPILDARKNEWYTARYRLNGRNGSGGRDGAPECLTAPKAIAPEEWLGELAGLGRKICFVGDAAEKNRALIHNILGDDGIALPDYLSLPRGAYAVQEVWRRYQEDRSLSGAESRQREEARVVEPFYIRLSEAEVNWAKKEEERKDRG